MAHRDRMADLPRRRRGMTGPPDLAVHSHSKISCSEGTEQISETHDSVDLDTPRHSSGIRRGEISERITGPPAAGDHHVARARTWCSRPGWPRSLRLRVGNLAEVGPESYGAPRSALYSEYVDQQPQRAGLALWRRIRRRHSHTSQLKVHQRRDEDSA